MRVNVFDVVELKSGNKATILHTNKEFYMAEIVDNKGRTKETKYIREKDIKKIIFKK